MSSGTFVKKSHSARLENNSRNRYGVPESHERLSAKILEKIKAATRLSPSSLMIIGATESHDLSLSRSNERWASARGGRDCFMSSQFCMPSHPAATHIRLGPPNRDPTEDLVPNAIRISARGETACSTWQRTVCRKSSRETWMAGPVMRVAFR